MEKDSRRCVIAILIDKRVGTFKAAPAVTSHPLSYVTSHFIINGDSIRKDRLLDYHNDDGVLHHACRPSHRTWVDSQSTPRAFLARRGNGAHDP